MAYSVIPGTNKQKRLYRVWANIVQRCTNPNNKRFKDYGEREISICEEWRNNYPAFERWALNSGYVETELHDHKCTLDRIDNNKGYSPDNCRFVDNITQCNNKRNNIKLACNGEEHTIQEWARIKKMPDYIIRDRLWKLHWTIEKAITTPVQSYRKR